MTKARNIADLGSNDVIETSATGVDVTGTVSADGLTVDGDGEISSTTPKLLLRETDTTDLNTMVRVSGGVFGIRTINDAETAVTERVTIDNSTGDFHLYEDTGTTAKFVWDASAESLQIGSGLATDTTLLLNGGDYDPTVEGGKNGKGLSIRGGTVGLGNRTGAVTFSMNEGGANAGSAAICGVSEHATSDDVLGLAFFTHSSTSSSAATVERMRLDSSGNLLVGTTDTAMYNNSSGTAADRGVRISPLGFIDVANYAGTVGEFNRTGNDGEIVNFRKDGSTVGSIGVYDGRPYLASATVGIRVSNALFPSDTSGVITDGAMNIGGTIGRWKDLYLSGGVYFGQSGKSLQGGSFTSSQTQNVTKDVLTLSGRVTYYIQAVDSGTRNGAWARVSTYYDGGTYQVDIDQSSSGVGADSFSVSGNTLRYTSTFGGTRTYFFYYFVL